MTEKTNGIPLAVRLHQALAAAGLPVTGVGREKSSGALRLDWCETPSTGQEQQAQAIIAGFDPAPSEAERLALAGIGSEQMLAALWAQVVEGDDALVKKIKEKKT
jgi:hypothetical protein